MLLRVAVVLGLAAVAAPAIAEPMNAESARKFVAGKLFSFTCFEGSTGTGRIFNDGSVATFILRGVCLYGIDSVMCPIERRKEAWKRLESGLDRRKLATMTAEIGLSGLPEAAVSILKGEVRGRIVVKIG